MNGPTRPAAEIARLGKEIYQRDVLPRVGDGHFDKSVGEYVAIDMDTGDWAIANSAKEALERLRTQRLGVVDVLMERVGYQALRSFGAGSLRRGAGWSEAW